MSSEKQQEIVDILMKEICEDKTFEQVNDKLSTEEKQELQNVVKDISQMMCPLIEAFSHFQNNEEAVSIARIKLSEKQNGS
jgi:hypothetical protein